MSNFIKKKLELSCSSPFLIAHHASRCVAPPLNLLVRASSMTVDSLQIPSYIGFKNNKKKNIAMGDVRELFLRNRVRLFDNHR